MKENKSTGHDDISARFIKLTAPYINSSSNDSTTAEQFSVGSGHVSSSITASDRDTDNVLRARYL